MNLTLMKQIDTMILTLKKVMLYLKNAVSEASLLSFIVYVLS